MAKFKKGDVVFTKHSAMGLKNKTRVVIVDEDDCAYPWSIDANGNRFAINEDNWELYKAPETQAKLVLSETPAERLAELISDRVLFGLQQANPSANNIIVQLALIRLLNTAGYTITETTPKVERIWTITPTKEPDTNSD